MVAPPPRSTFWRVFQMKVRVVCLSSPLPRPFLDGATLHKGEGTSITTLQRTRTNVWEEGKHVISFVVLVFLVWEERKHVKSLVFLVFLVWEEGRKTSDFIAFSGFSRLGGRKTSDFIGFSGFSGLGARCYQPSQTKAAAAFRPEKPKKNQ